MILRFSVFEVSIYFLFFKIDFQVTFDKDIRTRSVTLEGEVFDPAGTLSGGNNVLILLLNIHTK